MTKFNSGESYWSGIASEPALSVIDEDIETDVAIIGGGIAGLTSAYLLKQAGLRVVVLEKNQIGSGTTAGTTGKVTSQHGLMYHDMKQRLGQEVARLYGEANQTAIQQIDELIKSEQIDCDWQIDDNFVYTTDESKVKQYQQEAKTAEALGLPASFVTDTALPFKVAGAVKFSGQARFNARAYAYGLASLVNGHGSYVFVDSEANGISDGDQPRLKVNNHTVKAANVIVASKVPPWPLLARFSYGLLEYPQTSYIVAGDYDGDLKGMYISTDKDHYSIMPTEHDGHRTLLVGGQNHIPGTRRPGSRLDSLSVYAKKYFDVDTEYRWKAMDYVAYDDLPLIGKLYPWSKNLYVATGFKKWGLSTSMIAAIILRDAITGQPNPWARTFDSTRLRPVWSLPGAVPEMLRLL